MAGWPASCNGPGVSLSRSARFDDLTLILAGRPFGVAILSSPSGLSQCTTN